MSYTRDWNNNTPVDHTKFNQVPTTERNTKVDISDRLKNLLYGFTAGETQTDEGVKNLPFTVQSGDPGSTANKIKIYAKDVTAKAHAFIQDEDGNVIQLDSGGKINAPALGGVYPAASVSVLATILNFIYPVGSYYFNDVVSTNPGTLFGIGTWVAVAGRVLVGLDGAQTEFDSIGEEGGEKTHTLTESEMPLHGHPTATASGAGGDGSGGMMLDVNITSRAAHTGSVSSTPGEQVGGTGGGAAHNNLQPYRTVYMWRRTA